MDLELRVIRKSLYQDHVGKRLNWKLYNVRFIDAVSVDFSGDYEGVAEVAVIQPLMSKRLPLIRSDGPSVWSSSSGFDSIHLIGNSFIELAYSGQGNCRAFVELLVEVNAEEDRFR